MSADIGRWSEEQVTSSVGPGEAGVVSMSVSVECVFIKFPILVECPVFIDDVVLAFSKNFILSRRPGEIT